MSDAPGLTELLDGMTDAVAAPAIGVAGLALDSRRVAPGDVFLAYPGTHADGRAFISEAVARGAAAVVYEPEGFEYAEARAPGIAVAGLAGRVSEIAARFYGRPSEALCVVGVTGTNGKTSCVHFLAQALQQLDARPRMIGTLGCGDVWQPGEGELTTPDPLDLQRLLRQFVDAGATHAVMEVSSHALKQGRVAAVAFDAAVFTNLSRDHLDYHADIDDYAAAKKSLFMMPSLRCAVVNVEDEVGRQIAAEARAPVTGFGEQGAVRARRVQVRESGLKMQVIGPRGTLDLAVPLVGRINVANVLAVAGVLQEMGFEPPRVERALNRLLPVPGRMELFHSADGGPTAVVDYAHTPDALDRALASVREHCRGELWCVFGCGGDRDRGKRPEMGRIAETRANQVVVTNDNPRGEKPAQIAADILGGMQDTPEVILDRRQAITTALERARPGDWVLVAGKGHETYQIIGDAVTGFDDREVVARCLGKAA